MSDYWTVVTMHPEDPMTAQFDKCFTRFRNSTACFSPPPPKKNHKLLNFHLNATLHHKQFSKPQINKTQNSSMIYSSFPQWQTQIIQESCHRSQGFSPTCHHEEPGSIPDHWDVGFVLNKVAKRYVLNSFRTVPVRKVL